ncbi:MAG: DUF1573 domain-containing protein [Bacteroidota bacterium]
MVTRILSLFLLSVLFSCQEVKNDDLPENPVSPDLIHNPATGSSNKKDQAPIITFDDPVHDFGAISKGEKVSFAFHFRNTGNSDLIIRHAQASCGCTVPEWPKDAMAPGKDGYITVTFDSEGKSGSVQKTVTIISNTIPNTKDLTIKAQIQE